MNQYIVYIDVLGARNSSEKEDFDTYIKIITNFQNELIRISSHIQKINGRIHFFSDCAFIEGTSLIPLLKALQELRMNLINCNIFIRGAVSKGTLGAINGLDSENYIKEVYQNASIQNHFNAIKNNLTTYKDVIRGTLFYSKDIAKLVHYEGQLKGAAFYCDDSIKEENGIESILVQSGYLSNIRKKEFIIFHDIKYSSAYITPAFIAKVFRIFFISNSYDVNFGRYYLTILISIVNCSDFRKVRFDLSTNKFEDIPDIFDKIINLRNDYRQLYERSSGLEFLYLALINKVYSDIGLTNNTTRAFLKQVLNNKKYLNNYLNKISSIPKELLSMKSKNLLLSDMELLAEEEYK